MYRSSIHKRCYQRSDQICDEYGNDLVKPVVGGPHEYKHMEVKTGAKALIGNKYGRKGFGDD